MTINRVLSTIIILPVALYFAFIAWMYLSNDQLITHTLEHNKEIHTELLETATLVDKYIVEHRELPPYDKFGHCCYIISTIEAIKQYDLSYRKFKIRKPLENNDYFLVLFRGEWYEGYASQTQKTTLAFESSEYYIFNTIKRDGIFFSLVTALLFLICGWNLWAVLRKRQSISPTRSPR